METSDPLQQAVRAFRSGDRAASKRLLAQVLHADPRNVQAWLWMSKVAETDQRRRDCLLRVLAIEPDNEAALAGLDRLGDAALRGWTGRTAAGAPSAQGRHSSRQNADVAAAPGTSPAYRRNAERSLTLAAGLSLTLLVGLVLLSLTLFQSVPRARDRSELLSGQVLHTATLWCPSCAGDGRDVTLRTRIGARFYQGARASGLPHSTQVSVLRYKWSPLERRYYALVAAEGVRGWVPETQIRR
jgi:hypothetical protein